jgi:predicted membrane metal-binding protein
MEKIKGKILKELFINDAFVHYFLWPLILLSILLFFNLPQSLKLILMIFLGAVSIICLPFALYRLSNALYLVKIGAEIIVKNISVEHGLFGTKLKFEYEYAGMKYNNKKFFQTVWLPDKKSSEMKLLIDPDNPSNYVILDLKKKSVITLIKNRNM